MRYSSTCVATVVAGLACATSAQAAVLSLNHSATFGSTSAPGGAGTWKTATFDDGGTPGSVTLTLDTAGLVGSECVTKWYFNLDPALDATDLVFSSPNVTLGSLLVDDISLGTNNFKAGSAGKYDILIEVSSGNSGGGAKRFGVNESVQFTISGIASLTAQSFNFLSDPDGGHGPFVVASHVQGVGASGAFSAWTTVPEPASLLLIAAGLMAMAPVRGRKLPR